MQDFQKKVKKNAKYIIIQQITVPIINVLLAIYIIKKLSVIDYGIYNLLYAFIGYLTLFSSLGLLNVFQRFVPEYNAKKEYSKVKILLKSGIIIRFFLATIILVVLLILGKYINYIFKAENLNEYILLFSIGIVFFLEVQLVEVTLSSLLRNQSIMIGYLISTIIRAAITYFFLQRNMGLKGLLLAETIYYGILFSLLTFFYYKGFASKFSSPERKLSIKRLLRYSGFSYLDEVGWTILDVKTDFFIISSFLGPTMVGLYAFANQLVESVSKVMPFKILRTLIRTVFFTKFSDTDRDYQLNRQFNFLIKIIAFISFPIFLIVLVYADKIITYLFDVKYLSALNVLYIFVGFMMITSFQFPLQLVVQAVEKVEITFYAKIFSIYNLIGDLLIIHILGIIGIALITCSARLFQFIFIYYRIRKIVPLTFDIKSLLKILLNSLLMVGILYLLKDFVNDTVSLICFTGFGLLFYLSASFLNKSFFNEERQIINNFLPRPIFVF